MKLIRTAILILLACLLANCSTYYRMFGEKSTYFTDEEKALLGRISQSLDYDYGFDVDLKVDYVFSYTYLEKEIPENEKLKKETVAKDKNLNNALKGYSRDSVKAFYEKIYKLRCINSHWMNYYKEKKDWKNYTYLEKYILPSVVTFTDLLEKNVIQADKAYAAGIEQRKKEIEKQAELEIEENKRHQLLENDYDA